MKTASCAGAFLCAVIVLSGCGGENASRYTVPRGATISIAIGESIATDSHKAGDTFSGELISPLREGIVTYVPLESTAEGVVDFSGIVNENPPRARLTLRLTALHAPNGEVIPLETVPVVRESIPELRSDEVTITTGLDVDLSRLLGAELSSEARSSVGGDPRIEIARDSPLVFTLQREISLPVPAQ